MEQGKKSAGTAAKVEVATTYPLRIQMLKERAVRVAAPQVEVADLEVGPDWSSASACMSRQKDAETSMEERENH
jgi:hypothetical protein